MWPSSAISSSPRDLDPAREVVRGPDRARGRAERAQRREHAPDGGEGEGGHDQQHGERDPGATCTASATSPRSCSRSAVTTNDAARAAVAPGRAPRGSGRGPRGWIRRRGARTARRRASARPPAAPGLASMACEGTGARRNVNVASLSSGRSRARNASKIRSRRSPSRSPVRGTRARRRRRGTRELLREPFSLLVSTRLSRISRARPWTPRSRTRAAGSSRRGAGARGAQRAGGAQSHRRPRRLRRRRLRRHHRRPGAG